MSSRACTHTHTHRRRSGAQVQGHARRELPACTSLMKPEPHKAAVKRRCIATKQPTAPLERHHGPGGTRHTEPRRM
eukprot:7269146-Alexandrium_andersonii.AAC.1